MPSSGFSTLPLTTILALLRNACSGPLTGAHDSATGRSDSKVCRSAILAES